MQWFFPVTTAMSPKTITLMWEPSFEMCSLLSSNIIETQY